MQPSKQSTYEPRRWRARNARDEDMLDAGHFGNPEFENKAPIWVGIGFLAGLTAMVTGTGLAILVQWVAN